jgi:hypothetical protein
VSATYLDSILDGGIANPNFFNGRVLTAQDLRDAQRADRDRVRRLGQVLEPGVAAGLLVGKAENNRDLTVSAGLALNRLGATLLLPRDQVLPLVGTAPESAGTDSPFAPCSPTDPSLVGGVASGFYLLAITAATGLSTSRAPTSSLNGGDIACAARYEMDGVQLKLIVIPPVLPDGTQWQQDPPTILRAALVAACFGLPGLLSIAPDPFAAPPRYGLVDQLRANGSLLDCDVPLAVLRWRDQAIEMIDQWAVRRAPALAAGLGAYPPPTGPSSGADAFPQHADSRREVEARALLLQFQTQLEALRTTLADPPGTVASAHFTHLPAAGYLPLRADGRPRGFDWPTFFGLPTTPPPTELDPAYLRDLFHRSFFVDPIPLTGSPAIDLFTVLDADTNRPYVVFARRQRLPVSTPVDPPVGDPPPPTTGTATLIVNVTDSSGKTTTVDQIIEISARSGGVSFPAEIYRRHGIFDWMLGAQVEQAVAEAGRAVAATGPVSSGPNAAIVSDSGLIWRGPDIVVDPRLGSGAGLNDKRAAIFIFRALPAPADYLVRVVGRFSKMIRSTSLHLKADERRVITIVLRRFQIPPDPIPGKIKPRLPFVIPNGWAFDHGYIDPHWVRDPRPPGHRWDDPRPDWRVNPAPDLAEAFAAELERWAAVDPTIVVENPSLYIRPDFAPNVSYPEPYAFIRTGDGRYWPVVLVPGENAAGIDLPPARSGLADLDPAASAALLANGLPTLDAAAGAWTGLLGATLGLPDSGAASLQAEARGAARSLQGTFFGLPGVTPAANQALRTAFGDLVGLANAAPAAVENALGAAFSAGFAARLIDRARGVVPAESWSLDALNLNAAEQGALRGIGIDTVVGLLDQAATAAGRTALRTALNLDQQGLNRHLDTAAAGRQAGRSALRPERGVAALPGMSLNRAQTLVGKGLGTESRLALADRATIADQLGITLQAAGNLQSDALAAGRTGLVLESVPGITSAQAQALRTAGIGSIGDLLAADDVVVAGVLKNNAARVRESARTIATRIRVIGGGP